MAQTLAGSLNGNTDSKQHHRKSLKNMQSSSIPNNKDNQDIELDTILDTTIVTTSKVSKHTSVQSSKIIAPSVICCASGKDSSYDSSTTNQEYMDESKKCLLSISPTHQGKTIIL